MNYFVSAYGKFGSFICMISCALCSIIFARLAINLIEQRSLFSFVFMALAIGSAWSGYLYFPYQIIRISPRLTTFEEYIEYKHLFIKKRIYFKDITKIKINHLAGPLVMLDVYLEKGKLFTKFKKIDLSGLNPNYNFFLKEIEDKLKNITSGLT